MKVRSSRKGFSVIEIVVSAAVITIAGLAVTGAAQLYLKMSLKTADKTQAALLVEEGAEAIQLMRDMGWKGNIKDLSTTTNYQLSWNGSMYATTTSDVVIQGKYLRKFLVQDVRRDAQGDIGTSGAIDADTKKITFIVTLKNASTTILRSQMLIHNTYDN